MYINETLIHLNESNEYRLTAMLFITRYDEKK